MSERNLRKTRVGIVASDKMDKTVVVAIQDNVKHPLYKKIIKNTIRLKAHDENNMCGVGDKVLIIDDFLAKGNALTGLMEILQQAGAELVGCAIAIEKGFQGGGDALREKGIRVDSLAIIESMTDDSLSFRK